MSADTVTYGMPPNGYETVTLPTDLLADLDEYADATGADSRATAIRALLDNHTPFEDDTDPEGVRVEAVDEGALDDVASRTARRVVEELDTIR